MSVSRSAILRSTSRAERGHEALLLRDKLFDGRLEVGKGGVVGLRNGPGDDERRAGLVDEHRVHLVDDGEVVAALRERVGVEDERVVAQVVEAELVVGAVGDVGGVGGAALVGVGLVAVDHVHGEAVVGEHRLHPLRVALGEVRVDRHDVDAAPGEGVEEDRSDGHEGLALARLHLRDPALVERDPAEHLHVVGHHVPHYLLAARHVDVADEAAAGVLDGGEHVGEQLVEHAFEGVEPFAVEVVELADEAFALLGRQVHHFAVALGVGAPQAGAEGGLVGLDLLEGLLDRGPKALHLGAQFVVGEGGQGRVRGVDFVDEGPELFEFTGLLVTEEAFEKRQHKGERRSAGGGRKRRERRRTGGGKRLGCCQRMCSRGRRSEAERPVATRAGRLGRFFR